MDTNKVIYSAKINQNEQFWTIIQIEIINKHSIFAPTGKKREQARLTGTYLRSLRIGDTYLFDTQMA